jgi:hypothetical protein
MTLLHKIAALVLALVFGGILGTLLAGVILLFVPHDAVVKGAILCSLDGRVAEIVPSDSLDYRGNGDWYITHDKEHSVFHQAMIESCIWIPGWKPPVMAPVQPKPSGETLDHHRNHL